MYDKQVRRRRAVLALLVVVSLILLTGYFGEAAGGPLHSMQRGVVTIVSPVQDGASLALKPVRDLFGWIGSTLNAKSQRNKLQAEVKTLEQSNAQLAYYRVQYEQLAGLYNLDKQAGLGQYHPVDSRVIGFSPTVWYATITINSGSSAGVAANDAVIADGGLVGKVTTVAPDASIVTLISDSSSGVSAIDTHTSALGIVQPAVGNPTDLLLQYVADPASSAAVGDMIETSGSAAGSVPSVFPPGIPIGNVTSVDTGNIYENVHVHPFANLHQLDDVQVLTGAPDTNAALASVSGG